jgi:hypothetical protein
VNASVTKWEDEHGEDCLTLYVDGANVGCIGLADAPDVIDALASVDPAITDEQRVTYWWRRAKAAEERLARIAECLRQMADWDDYPPANDIFAMALVQVAGIARGDS